MRIFHFFSLNKTYFRSWLRTKPSVPDIINYSKLALKSIVNWKICLSWLYIEFYKKTFRSLEWWNTFKSFNHNKKVPLKKSNKFSKIKANLQSEISLLFRAQLQTFLNSLKLHLLLEILKFCSQLFLIFYRVFLYNCKFQHKIVQKLFEVTLIFKIHHIYLEYLQQHTTFQRQLAVSFSFKKTQQRYHGRNLLNLKEEFLSFIHSQRHSTNPVNFWRKGFASELQKVIA